MSSRLILLHGFTQTGRSWDGLRPAFEEAGFEVAAPDIPAGQALWPTAHTLFSGNGGGAWLGYSMGGRIALHVALAHPDDVSRLVLVGATPGIVDPIDRA